MKKKRLNSYESKKFSKEKEITCIYHQQSLSFTYKANGKHQFQVEEFLKIENKQIKPAQKILIDKKLGETTKFCVEIMKSRRQVGGKLVGQVVQIRVCRLMQT